MTQPRTEEINRELYNALNKDLHQLTNTTRESVAKDILFEIVSNMDPMLEQNFWRLILDLAHAYDKMPNSYYDARNRAVRDLTYHITTFDGHLPHI